jgi:hypothetical protein
LFVFKHTHTHTDASLNFWAGVVLGYELEKEFEHVDVFAGSSAAIEEYMSSFIEGVEGVELQLSEDFIGYLNSGGKQGGLALFRKRLTERYGAVAKAAVSRVLCGNSGCNCFLQQLRAVMHSIQ